MISIKLEKIFFCNVVEYTAIHWITIDLLVSIAHFRGFSELTLGYPNLSIKTTIIARTSNRLKQLHSSKPTLSYLGFSEQLLLVKMGRSSSHAWLSTFAFIFERRVLTAQPMLGRYATDLIRLAALIYIRSTQDHTACLNKASKYLIVLTTMLCTEFHQI